MRVISLVQDLWRRTNDGGIALIYKQRRKLFLPSGNVELDKANHVSEETCSGALCIMIGDDAGCELEIEIAEEAVVGGGIGGVRFTPM